VSIDGVHGGVLYCTPPAEADRILCRTQYTNSRCSLAAGTMGMPSRAKSSLSVTRCASGDAGRTGGVRELVEIAYASEQISAVSPERLRLIRILSGQWILNE
jgi:hypothetical protein